jgi:hypothetical protein
MGRHARENAALRLIGVLGSTRSYLPAGRMGVRVDAREPIGAREARETSVHGISNSLHAPERADDS